MFWWKEIADLKQRLSEVEDELRKEQGKAVRLKGFLSRLQHFGISPTGQAPHREFADALVDSMSALLVADQVVLLETEAATRDLLPLAARGVSPETLSRLRVPVGKSILGRAAEDMKTALQNSTVPTVVEESFFVAPYLVIPLVSRAACVGLVLLAKPQAGSFSPEAQELALILAKQAALIFEDHAQHQELKELSLQMVNALLRALEAKDEGTHKHSDRTRSLVRAIAQEIPLPESLIQEVEYGAYLHDLGKIGIDEAILRKPGKLTPVEYAAIKEHPAIGQRILQPLIFLRQVGAIVLYHQEWYNGAGYPEGLAGEEIPLGARIVQIIDAWDAMTSDRPYRKAMPKTEAVAELRRQEGTQFDPKLVELFLRVVDRLEREGVPTTEQKGGSVVTAALP